MKHKLLIICVTITVAVSTLVGCYEDWGVDVLPQGKTGNICFFASISATDKEATTRYDGYLTVQEEEWKLEGVEANTRSDVTTTLSSNAGLVGFIYDTWSTSLTPWNRMYDTEYTFSQNVDSEDDFDLNPTDDSVPWGDVENDYLRVYAYAPKSFIGSNATLSGSSTAGVPTITYTVPNAPESQSDLLAAVNEVAGNYYKAVPLEFNHALTAIRFKVGFACVVKTLKIEGVYKKGTYQIGETASTGWTADTSAGTYSYTFTINKTFTDDDIDNGDNAITEGAATLMLIPQNLPDGAKVTMTYNDGSDHTLTASIAGNTWQPGKLLTYTVSKSPSYSVYLYLALASVSITPTGYSGKVKINTSTTPEDYTYNVTGLTDEQMAAIKFYVFQSNPDDSSSPGYNKGWTKGITIGDDGQVTPDEGSEMELPEYEEVTHSGMTWSEYVTNNSNSAEVMDAWASDAESKKRTSTNNRIYANDATGHLLKLDLTIDNLWSMNFSDNMSSGGIVVGDNYAVDVNRQIQSVLRLKGDNRFRQVLFCTPNETDYFHITSFYGDGSTKGSISVMPSSSSVNNILDGGLISKRMEHSYGYTPRQYTHGFVIKGGTIYSATPVTHNNSLKPFWGCLGGGRNTSIMMEISGGNITAVAHGTSPAIGAGGGGDNWGGDAEITISGGRVFAYHKGCSAWIGTKVSSTNSLQRPVLPAAMVVVLYKPMAILQ